MNGSPQKVISKVRYLGAIMECILFCFIFAHLMFDSSKYLDQLHVHKDIRTDPRRGSQKSGRRGRERKRA